jgi:hypothetical protein
MADPIDVYTDQFNLNINPYGATLNFSISSATLPAPGTAPQSERVATVRMSHEHMKVMAFILRNQILQYEQQTGVNIQIPIEVLNGLRISREDWDTIWK